MLHRLRNEAGTATAELALCLPILVMVLAAVLAAVSVAATRVRVEDAAREAARAAARGDPAAADRGRAVAPGARVTVVRDATRAMASVTVSVQLVGDIGPPVTVSADATAALEPTSDAQGSDAQGLDVQTDGPG